MALRDEGADRCIIKLYNAYMQGGTVVKILLANERDAKDMSSILGSGRSPEEGNGNQLQYSCLENTMDRVWWTIVHRVTKSQRQLSA